MCFSVPLKVLRVSGNTAIVEGEKKVQLGKDIAVKKGDYLQVTGSLAVGKLNPKQGLKVRKLIKSLSL